MPPFARRFRRNAGLLALAAAGVLVAVVVTAAMLTSGPDSEAAVVLWVVALALVAAAVTLVVTSRLRSIALRQVRAANPDGLVFLARRQPSVVSDLAAYLNESDVYDEVSDRWVVASIDRRGMAAWSVGRNARELLLVPWSEIADVEVTRLESGRAGVAVDVRPFPTPLVVAVGYAAWGIMSAFGARGTAEVVAATNALRPPAPAG